MGSELEELKQLVAQLQREVTTVKGIVVLSHPRISLGTYDID